MKNVPNTKSEFGDFQTPISLADSVIEIFLKLNINPSTIIEPTCGVGAFVISSAKKFPDSKIICADINPTYIEKLKSETFDLNNLTIFQGDFFLTDWKSIFSKSDEPILVIGNYPWVTNSDLGALVSSNLPTKSNISGVKGMNALTGKSNFDISEWMLQKNIEWLNGRNGTIAMLCKTNVARKTLLYCWKNSIRISDASIYKIDAKKHFNASVDACLLILNFNNIISKLECKVFADLDTSNYESILGFERNMTIPNLSDFKKYNFLYGGDYNYIWRSGVKHDCSKVMELNLENDNLINGFNEIINIETIYLYPLLKSSDLNINIDKRNKFMLVPQKYVGEATSNIELIAPSTWKYLNKYSGVLESRSSSIYRNKPNFSVFGIGDYTFKPWKVAISGFYKTLKFTVVGPKNGRPVVFDDTVNFLGLDSEDEAYFIATLLNSQECKTFLNSMIFWEDKRPITIELLKKLNVGKLAYYLGLEDKYNFYSKAQMQLFI